MEGKRTLLSRSVGRAMWLQRDASDKEGTHQVAEHYLDEQNVLGENAQLRQANAIPKGTKIGMHDGAELQYFFRPESLNEWEAFLREHEGLETLLNLADDIERTSAAQRVAILKPQWVVTA